METLRKTSKSGAIMALAAVMALLMSIACSDEAPTPAERPDGSQRELVQRLDRMSGDIAALRQEVEESQRQPAETAPAAATTPTATDEAPDATATRTPTDEAPTQAPTPTKAVPPTPSGPGICGRSPEIQKAILESLDLNLCQVATEGELFRITGLGNNLSLRTVKAGDFQGLVNIEKLDLDATKVDPNAFAGMTSLKEMDLSVRDEGSIAAGAFQDLPGLKTLTLRIASNGKAEPETFRGLPSLETLSLRINEASWDEDTFLTPEIDGTPNLKEITLRWFETKSMASNLFDNLPNLESAEISIEYKGDEKKGDEFQIPDNLFENNTKLKKVSISIGAREKVEINLPESLFSKNPLLEEIKIRSERARIEKGTFRHLTELKKLELHEYLTEEGWQDHKLALHEDSPLYSLITLGGKRPNGYTLIEDE